MSDFPSRGMTVAEAARRLDIHERTVWDWIRAGDLTVIHLGPPQHGITLVTHASLAKARKPFLIGMRVRKLGLTPKRPARARKAKAARSR